MARPRQIIALAGLLAATASSANAAAVDPAVALHEARHGQPTTLTLVGDADLEVLLGPPSSPEVIVYMHGVCGDPLAFRSWGRSARRYATFVSMRGDEVCKTRPSRRRWSYRFERLDRRIDAAILAVDRLRPGATPLSRDDVTLVGYSQGAHRAERLAATYPERYRRVVLIAPANKPRAARLAKLERVLLMAGGWDAKAHIFEGFQDLERRKHPARYLELPQARHGQYGPEAERIMDEALRWLLVDEPAPRG